MELWFAHMMQIQQFQESIDNAKLFMPSARRTKLQVRGMVAHDMVVSNVNVRLLRPNCIEATCVVTCPTEDEVGC